MGSKEYTVTLTGQQRWDLWLFFYRLGGYRPRDLDGARNLGAVLEEFSIKDINDRLEEKITVGDKITPKDVLGVECKVGSVDLKRLIEYLATLPDGVSPQTGLPLLDTATTLRILELSDYLKDIKDRKPKLEAVPEDKEGA